MESKIMTTEQLHSFRAYLRDEERSEATVEKYFCEVTQFAAWLNNTEVTKAAVAEWKEHLLSEGYEPSTVNGKLTAMDRFFDFMGWQECRVRPVRVQRRNYSEPRRELTRQEYYRLLHAAHRKGDLRLFHLLETICSTGIRVSELRFITVKAVQRGRADICNKGKYRTILLPRRLCEKLLHYCRERGIAHGSIFVTRSGKPVNRSNIWAMMKTLCRKAQVSARKVFPHNLRHLFARCFYQCQQDLEHLASLLGHSSINTTRIYTRTSGEEHLRQIEKLRLIL